MCFSAQASFALGAALVPSGIYCLRSALLKKPSWWGLAAVPLLFGIQQISEGFVWLGIEHEDTAQIRLASLFFLFFALALWPCWFLIVAACTETDPRKRIAFCVLGVLACGWFWLLYFPLLVGPDSLLTTSVQHHSIQYSYWGLPVYRYVHPWALRVLYLLSVALPMVFSTAQLGRLPGIALGGTAVVAVALYDYAFVSVWCFFASFLAIYCCYIFYCLPSPGEARLEKTQAQIPVG